MRLQSIILSAVIGLSTLGYIRLIELSWAQSHISGLAGFDLSNENIMPKQFFADFKIDDDCRNLFQDMVRFSIKSQIAMPFRTGRAFDNEVFDTLDAYAARDCPRSFVASVPLLARQFITENAHPIHVR